MNCRYFTRRRRKYEFYWFCRFYKKQIKRQRCDNCSKFEVRIRKGIKKKSGKLARMEKKRFSILTDNFEYCYVCGKRKEQVHEIFGGRNRQVSIKHGFCIPICKECHDKTETDMKFDKELKKECQRKFEEIHTRDDFLKLVDKNYL